MEIKPFEKGDFDKDILVSEVSVTYYQSNDNSGEDPEEDGVQEIRLKTRDNGIARYINIKTDSWSIESAEEFSKLIKDFSERAGLLDDKEDGLQKN